MKAVPVADWVHNDEGFTPPKVLIEASIFLKQQESLFVIQGSTNPEAVRWQVAQVQQDKITIGTTFGGAAHEIPRNKLLRMQIR